MAATDYTRYHGGDLGDELASLVSLALGIQLRNGGQTRWFDIDGDQWGKPVEFDRDPPYLEPPHPHRRPLLPHIADQVLLDDAISTLERYPRISGPQAVSLVRAARSYQQALWIADDDPNLAWLHLVSAVETAAGQWGREQGTPEDILRDARPDIMERLEASGDQSLIADVAALVAPLFKSTARFINFLVRFLPPPPTERPAPYYQVYWSTSAMRRSLRKVYDWRSWALHDGVPFPDPMCWPPRAHGEPLVLEELPAPIAAAAGGGVWIGRDLPFALHIFAYIVRGALLRWWCDMTEMSS